MADLYVLLTAILLAGYGSLILLYHYWFKKLRVYKPSATQPATGFTVIIPARNEAEGIEACLRSVLDNRYPVSLFEVIVIDDFSTDDTAAVIRRLQQSYTNLKLIELQNELGEKPINSYKKKAIEIAIGKSLHEWIVTTDADCLAPAHWLSLFDAYIQQHQPVFIAAPVMFFRSNTSVSVFQTLDFISLQGITAASVSAGAHSMCNGANLAYNKAAFYAVNGFKGIDNIASGDDMLLMHKLQQQYPAKTGYLFTPEAIIFTAPMHDWKSFINQRIRWASKASYYNDKRILAVLVLVYLLNALLFFMPLTALAGIDYLLYWPAFILVKTTIELPFMIAVARFYNMQQIIWYFLPMQPVHILYTVVAGWLGKFGKYQWKGRTVK
jgi:cellulose synthase/poly-beta-1,6-N-acetylglucosamine synthase-like glycosyltransferase